MVVACSALFVAIIRSVGLRDRELNYLWLEAIYIGSPKGGEGTVASIAVHSPCTL